MKLNEILAVVARIVGESDHAATVAQMLEDYAAEYHRSYAGARRAPVLGEFLHDLEEAVEARIPAEINREGFGPPRLRRKGELS